MYLKSLSPYLLYRVASTLIFNVVSNPRYLRSSCYYPSFSGHSHFFRLRSRMGEIGAHPSVGACCACLSLISRVCDESFLFVFLFVVHRFHHSSLSYFVDSLLLLFTANYFSLSTFLFLNCLVLKVGFS